MRARHLQVALLLAAVLAGGCRGPGHVEFTEGRCVIDGKSATLAEVEDRQAQLSERILRRQPLFVGLTVLIVALAGVSHIEKLLLLFSTRRTAANGLGARLRLALDRYRDHPVRYFSIVVGTLLLLGCAGGFYVGLDADKRASERALNLLQFCHTALRSTEAQGILFEQRRNLETIEATAGTIRALVDKLPPAEQQKAKQIVDEFHASLASEGRLVTAYVNKTDESSRAVLAETQALGRGIASVQNGVGALQAMPGALKDLAERLKALDGRAQATEASTGTVLAALKAELDALKARPDPKCPACVCGASRDGGAP